MLRARESAEKFAKTLSILIDLFNPEVIVAGGVFMRNYELFMPVMRPILERECLSDSYQICEILPAKIGENIGDYASLALAVLEEPIAPYLKYSFATLISCPFCRRGVYAFRLSVYHIFRRRAREKAEKYNLILKFPSYCDIM